MRIRFSEIHSSHNYRKLVYSLSRLQDNLNSSRITITEKHEIRATIEEVQLKIDGYNQDVSQITSRIASRSRAAADLMAAEPLVPGGRRADETQRNYLIRELFGRRIPDDTLLLIGTSE